jgi:hypothetical protein
MPHSADLLQVASFIGTSSYHHWFPEQQSEAAEREVAEREVAEREVAEREVAEREAAEREAASSWVDSKLFLRRSQVDTQYTTVRCVAQTRR